MVQVDARYRRVVRKRASDDRTNVVPALQLLGKLFGRAAVDLVHGTVEDGEEAVEEGAIENCLGLPAAVECGNMQHE